MKQSERYSGTYSGPTTPENGGGGPKSWSSERSTNPSSRRHVSWRALPSKWDDAERWITSPVSSCSSTNAIPRRPMSKSGPLGPHFMPNSPITDAGVVQNDVKTSGPVPVLLRRTSSRDEKPDGSAKEERDTATQMSPADGSNCSSSKGRLLFSALPVSSPAPFHQNDVHSSRDEVRDVQVDKGITTADHSEKQGVGEMKDSSHAQNINPLPWNASEQSKDTSRLQREEAKITAWENLQKAKAEAAIRKLEMKLEKKRSASMDNIMNKLRASEMRARDMRNLLSENDAPEARTTSSRGGFSFSKYVKVHLYSNCFVCRRN